MSKKLRMYRAFLSLEQMTANVSSYDAFVKAISNYKYFCKLEKRIAE